MAHIRYDELQGSFAASLLMKKLVALRGVPPFSSSLIPLHFH